MSALETIVITNDTARAALAVRAGVSRIMVDLESIGKADRQPAGSLISAHSFDDISAIRAAIPAAMLIVRINPVGATSVREVEEAITRGADFIMLPMVMNATEMTRIANLIAGRVKLIPLIEHAEALRNAEAILDAGADEAYLGLNDLHLSLNQHFMFEPLAEGLVDRFAGYAAARHLPFGFGGVGKIGAGLLPAQAVIGEHARLGSTRVIVSRAFDRALESEGLHADNDYIQGIKAIHDAYDLALLRSSHQLQAEHVATIRTIREIAGRAATRASA